MRFRFILSETWNSLKRNVSMIISVMLVTFISFLFIGVSGLMQAQITAAKGEWYDKVEVVVWLCPDGASQAASCASGLPRTPAASAMSARSAPAGTKHRTMQRRWPPLGMMPLRAWERASAALTISASVPSGIRVMDMVSPSVACILPQLG